MSDVSTLAAELRDRAGKGAARATRRAGRVPAVIYGDKQAPVLISLDPRHIWAELNKPGFKTRMFEITAGGKTERCLARDVQFHPVTDRPEHVDFQRVGANSKIHVEVPVRFLNQEKCPGLKQGGVLNIVRHGVDVTCLASAVPDHIDIDLAEAQIGDSIHISSVTLPAGVKPTIDRDFTVATIAAPTVKAGAAEGESA